MNFSKLFVGICLWVGLLSMGGVAQAATVDFTFVNNTGQRARSATIMGEGEVIGFKPSRSGEQTFQVKLPDGQCVAILRIKFKRNEKFHRDYFDHHNNFCHKIQRLTLRSGKR